MVGAADGEQKVHWVAWDKMCTCKHEGGMGFRDFEIFNRALLAEQVWRLITVPDSLCAGVLKARYFLKMDIMAATYPKGCSYTWQSLMHGKNLLQHGLLWRIGDGSRINVYQDQWIPRAASMVPLGATYIKNVMEVADLLNTQGNGWDAAKLRQVFTPDDALDVQKIVIGGASTDDFRA